MSRLFLITLLVVSSSLAYADELPAPELWSTAMEKFSARNFKNAIPLFEDYLNRFPGTPEAIDARTHLAQSYLFTKNPVAAIPVFRAVIETRGKSDLGNEARTYLGQAYLDAGKFSEAYLVSTELTDQKELGVTFRAKALLLRAHAQAGLGQNLEAEKTLVAFQAISESDPELERETANSFLVSLLLKSNRCDALPSAKALPEDQVLDQIARKGICVLEMGTLLTRAAKRLSAEETTQAIDTLATTLKAFRRACETPPLAPGKLPARKLLAAKRELVEKLREGCRNVDVLLREAFRDRETLKAALTKLELKDAGT